MIMCDVLMIPSSVFEEEHYGTTIVRISINLCFLFENCFTLLYVLISIFKFMIIS